MYDVLIIGGGPAGYSAGLYAVRAGLHAVVIEKLAPGGQMGTTDQIDNYPGFDRGINGFDLAMKMKEGAERFGCETIIDDVQRVILNEPVKTLFGTEKYEAKTVILAMGASPRELGLEGERQLRGKGISYCATCDGMFYRGKTAAIAGGGDTAAADALFLSKLCAKVYLIHRRDTLRAARVYERPLQECENVEFIWDTTVSGLLAEERLHGVQLRNVKTGALRELSCDGLFVAIGNVPQTKLIEGQIMLNQGGYVMADETTKTNLPGVFAAGDLREKPLRQVVTAAADGAVAAKSAEEYLSAL